MIKLWKLSLCLFAFSGVALASNPSAIQVKAVGEEAPYTLVFEDNFDGSVSEEWAYIKGGSSTETGWDFGSDIGYIGCKTNNNIAFKFLYGTASSTNYAYEFKFRADVDKNLGEYMAAYTNPADGMSINITAPFFVSDPMESSVNQYKGRAISINNYAAGFFEFGTTNGWVQSVRLNTLFDNSFDWRDYHTIRVTCSTVKCELFIDNVLVSSKLDSAFTRSTGNVGYCGFVGNPGATMVPSYYDDFKVYSGDPYSVFKSDFNVSDFLDSNKAIQYGKKIDTGVAVSGNTMTFDRDAGSHFRFLKTEYFDTKMQLKLDIDDQISSKESDGKSTDIRTSDVACVFFRTNTSTIGSQALNGYAVRYYAIHERPRGTSVNTVKLELLKFSGAAKFAYSTISNTSVTLSGRTDVYLEIFASGSTIGYKAYGSSADMIAETNALATKSTVDTTYKSGSIGFRVNTGKPDSIDPGYSYAATFHHLSGTVVSQQVFAVNELFPASTESATQVISVVIHGFEKGTFVAGSDTIPFSSWGGNFATHSDLTIVATPNEGYKVLVTINGVPYSGTTINLKNITCRYEIHITFYSPAEDFVTAWRAMRNDGGEYGICNFIDPNHPTMQSLLAQYEALTEEEKAIVDATVDVGDYTIGESIEYVKAMLDTMGAGAMHGIDGSLTSLGSVSSTSLIVLITLLGFTAIAICTIVLKTKSTKK